MELELTAEVISTRTAGQALKRDLVDIQRLDVEVYKDDAYTYFILRQFLDIAGELFQVCKDSEGNVIAYGIIVPSANQGSGWLLSLAVSFPHRRKGIGTELVNQLLAKAKSSSLEKIYLTVEPDNKPAIFLYERLGFIAAKVEHQYQIERHYFGPDEHRIVMYRPLDV